MRALRKNMQKMWYSLYERDQKSYKRDKNGEIQYVMIDGDRVPLENTERKIGYSKPVEFWANIAGNSGEAQASAFGVSVGDYDATLYFPKGKFPIDENSLIWYDNEPDLNREVDPDTADFTVARKPVCLDEAVFLLKRVIK